MQLDICAAVRQLLAAKTPLTAAQAITVVIGTSPAVVLARVWRAEPSGSLTLMASCGTPSGGGSYSRTDGTFARIAPGSGKIAAIAVSRQPLIVSGVRGDEPWLANAGWAARQGVRLFAGYPLVAGSRLVGVLAVFDREVAGDATLATLAFAAEVAGTRIGELMAREADRAPGIGVTGGPVASSAVAIERAILTRADLRALERRNIEAALARSRGRIFGPHGAAELLGMKPTTLASRIRTLRIGPRAERGM